MDQSDLLPYQERVVQRLLNPKAPGLLAWHSTGTGKTRSSIESIKQLHLPTTVVVPASLQENYRKELKKWMGKIPSDLKIESQQAVARKGLQYNPPGGALVVDEAQHGRETDSKLIQELKKSRAVKRLLLSGTPVFNDPSDIAPLINLAAGKTVLPEDKKEFHKRYVGESEVKPNFMQRMMGLKPGLTPGLKNTPELQKVLKQYVDFQKGTQENFPEVKDEVLKVPMGEQQTNIYKSIMGESPWWVRWKVKAGLPPGKGELEQMRAFLTGARQVSNTAVPFMKKFSAVNPIVNPNPNKPVYNLAARQAEEPKITQAVNYLRDQIKVNPRYKGVVYSNYLESGLQPYKEMLQSYNIPYGEFSGDIKEQTRNKLVNDYNANKIKALLISSAGAEGLDLKGTRLLQILEPHFNLEKEKQIIGRASRYKSHDALPPEERNVLVQRYLAQPRSGAISHLFGREGEHGTDEYIRNLALNKAKLNDQLVNLVDPQAQKKTFLQRILGL